MDIGLHLDLLVLFRFFLYFFFLQIYVKIVLADAGTQNEISSHFSALLLDFLLLVFLNDNPTYIC